MQETGNNIIYKNTRLAIRVGSGSLSFSAVDRSEAGGVVYEPYRARSGVSMAANLRDALQECQLPQKRWNKALLAVDTPVLMVPTNEFDESKKHLFYTHTITGMEAHSIEHTVLPSINAVALFAVNKDLKLVVEDNFGDVKFAHVCSPVWNCFYKRNFTSRNNKLYCYLHDKNIDVFCFRQNRFKFTNSFSAAHTQDAVYFILYVWQQLAFNPQKDEIFIAGQPEELKAIVKELQVFTPHAFIVNPRAEFNRAPVTSIPGIPFDLMALYAQG